MSGAQSRSRALPAVMAANTGHALILLDTTTGQVQAVLGEARQHPAVATAVSVPPPRASWGTDEVQAVLTPMHRAAACWLIRAAAALVLTLLVRSVGRQRRSFARMVRLARLASAVGEPADRRHAHHAVDAVRYIAQYIPARVACLEESVAAAVTLALAGHHGQWRHGIATDPIRLHAWLQADGQPVAEPATTGRHTPLIRLPQPPREGGPVE